MYSNVLVPIDADQNDGAIEALKAARGVLSDGGKITILTVVEKPPMYVSESLPVGYESAIEKSALETVKRLVGTPDGIEVAVARGKPAQQILDHAQQMGNDCIIVSARPSSLEHFLMGSVSQRVVRRASCPVLVLR